MSTLPFPRSDDRPPDLLSPHRRPLFRDDVARALVLSATYLGDGRFEVSGGRETHYVELAPYFECYCRVFLFPGDRLSEEELEACRRKGVAPLPIICKHLIAALLLARDPEAVDLAAAIQRERDAASAAEATDTVAHILLDPQPIDAVPDTTGREPSSCCRASSAA